jgi:hypothetical protein
MIVLQLGEGLYINDRRSLLVFREGKVSVVQPLKVQPCRSPLTSSSYGGRPRNSSIDSYEDLELVIYTYSVGAWCRCS